MQRAQINVVDMGHVELEMFALVTVVGMVGLLIAHIENVKLVLPG